MLKKIRTFLQTFRLPILSGILIGTSYIPFPPWAYPFAFVPLWWFWWHETSLRRIVWAGWITQFVLTFIGFNWVAHTVHEFGHLPWPIAILALLAFCGFANLYVPFVGWIWGLYRKRFRPGFWPALLPLPALTALAHQFLPTIFPWNMGYPWMWIKLPGFQLAEYVGFFGLAALTIFFNLFTFMAIKTWHQTRLRWAWLGSLAALLALINGVGAWRARHLPDPDQKLKALIVQANIGNLEKQYAEAGWGFRWSIVSQYVELTKKGLEAHPGEVSFAVWPETAFPDSLSGGFSANSHSQLLERFLRDNALNLLTGGYGRMAGTGQTTNSFFLIDGQGRQTDTPYSKTHLLAFGEYFPGADLFPILRKWIPEVGDFGRGEGPSVKTLGGLRLGPQICYESLFPRFTLRLADQGAQVLVNVTNDSWYGKWQEPYQHLYMTLARAVEVRRPLIRSTNTGISTVVLADGSVLETSPLHEPWQHLYTVPYSSQPPTTFYQKSYWLIPALLALLVILCLAFSVGALKKRSASA